MARRTSSLETKYSNLRYECRAALGWLEYLVERQLEHVPEVRGEVDRFVRSAKQRQRFRHG